MAHHSPSMPMSRIAAAAALCLSSTAWSQAQEIVITSPTPQQVSGFGDVPLSKAPFSGVQIDSQTLRDIGATRISDALRLDASVTDSYNSPAYWDTLSVRGYTLDNRYNYRREGLPISAETMIPMDNKERIELLKGTSGIQAGTSAPGGLANYLVKRAPSGHEETIRSLTASYGNGKSSSLALDLGARFGENKDFGYRLNAAYEDLNPYIQNTQGHRKLAAMAMDWRITPDSKLEWEFEHSERQQIGVNGYSLLGDTLPAPVNGTRNLTWQSWAVPGVFNANTGSVRFKQNLANGWLWTTSYGAQRLKTDDRLIFGYGCGNSDYSRYCADGSFSLYDYRSEGERRISDALETALSGEVQLGGFKHQLNLSFLRARQLDRMPMNQSFALINVPGTVYSSFSSQPNPDFSGFNTNRSEYSSEVAIKDRLQLSESAALWAGIRHVQLDRSSVRTEPSYPNAKRFKDSANTPWLALSNTLADWTGYISYGEGFEQFVVPNSTGTYWVNAGELLGTGKSKQTEIGLRSPLLGSGFKWSATAFDISRPLAYDDGNGSRLLEGRQKHQGLELSAQWTNKVWLLSAQALTLHPRIDGVTTLTELNDKRPINAPSAVVRALAQYRWADVPGLRTSLRLSHEGERRVLEDGSIKLPAWTTLDFAAHYDTRVSGMRTEWTFAVDNLTDRHYWRESPKQFGHYYLYPGAPRTGRITVRTSF
jgi:iron complex outermembrane recepter protein